jgi:hypothetical protein
LFYYEFKGSYFAAIVKLADNLVSKYRGVRTKVAMVKIITYGNALIPEAMLFEENVLK